ncbi:OmpP1/FadL family transporter [Rhodobacter maris]|uniref:Long-subunit fatty acid transport protein n=1 Tax=Rhodobacter maris TaxID=446682 RepID=A0A285SVX9_9RHOB|nr:outer membrane protein transport protein [Rhodobacter maris]SOC12162.1 long-subunit fatty acid transport protein [Rhodobacter maris]
MKKFMLTASALVLGATAATAGGIERSSQSVGILFEQGNYAEFSIGGFRPDVSGSGLNSTMTGTTASGDMAGDYGAPSIAVKMAINEKLDFALVLDSAIGANIHYPSGSGYFLQGSNATISNTELTAMLRYKLPQNFSVIGGVRGLRTSGKVSLPSVGSYSMNSTTETDYGYLVGVAWEKPEIAARVALTYNSKIDHDFTYHESSLFTGGAVLNTVETVTIPESVNLEFQTGVAKDTLVFGSVRWVHWTQFDITPDHYANTMGQGALVDYTENTTTYSLGLGRKFSEKWSGAAIVGYEKHTGTRTGNLGPTDGFRSIALAATYKVSDNVKVTGAVRYVDIGDARTNLPINGDFTGNSGWGAGVRVGINF